MVPLRHGPAAMDLNRFRYLSIIAAEGSLHRAAARLSIDQPALSRKIKQLEQELGATLFIRSASGVRLTPSGEALLEDLERLIPQLDFAFDRARRAEAGVSTILRIALTPFASDSRFPIKAFAETRERLPEIELRLNVLSSHRQIEELKADRIDIGVLHQRGPLPAGIGCRELRVDRYQLAVCQGHPLARKETVRLADLQPFDFIFAPQSQWPAAYHEWMTTCEQAGLRPNVAYEAQTEGMFLNIIGEGLAIGFANSAMCKRPFPDVAYLDVVDLDIDLPFIAMWNRQRERPVITTVVNLLSRHAALGSKGAHAMHRKADEPTSDVKTA